MTTDIHGNPVTGASANAADLYARATQEFALYVGGRQDMGAAPEVMQAMADATPGGVYLPIENAAHVANINAPEAFNAAIRDFLDV